MHSVELLDDSEYEFEWSLSIHFARVDSGGSVRLSTRQVGPTCIVFGAELRCT